jgi:hypothetical protein
VPGAALGVVAACLMLAVVAEAAFNKAVSIAVGAPPLRLPHPMARLIDMGPGTNYLQKNCPRAGFAVCDYVQVFPTGWEDFLFSRDPAKGVFALADTPTKRRLSDEQISFALAVLRHDPVGVVKGIGIDVFRQLGRFDVDIWGGGKSAISLYFQGRVPDEVLAGMKQSRALDASTFRRWVSLSNLGLVLASLGLGAWAWRQRARLPTALAQKGFNAFTAIALAGVVANAVVCAALASSMDRFQARVIWLLPLLALAGLLLMRRQHLATPSEPSAPSTSSTSSTSPLEGVPS